MLPGFDVQQQMSPPFRKKYTKKDAYAKNAKESAVLILLFEKNNEPYIVLTERKTYNGAHSGQISLPGGKREANERIEYTALREAKEEIGVELDKIYVLAELSFLYIPVSNYIVFPFVGVYSDTPKFFKEEDEVERIIEIRLSELLNVKNMGHTSIKMKNGFVFEAPAYLVGNIKIWGATAMIICEFLEILKD